MTTTGRRLSVVLLACTALTCAGCGALPEPLVEEIEAETRDIVLEVIQTYLETALETVAEDALGDALDDALLPPLDPHTDANAIAEP